MTSLGMVKLTPIDALEDKAMLVLRHGRVFYQETSLGDWIGFRLGKVEINMRLRAAYGYEMEDSCYVPRLITRTDAWKLPQDWILRILRDACNALGEKIKGRYIDKVI